jgi:hypothetical protein
LSLIFLFTISGNSSRIIEPMHTILKHYILLIIGLPPKQWTTLSQLRFLLKINYSCVWMTGQTTPMTSLCERKAFHFRLQTLILYVTYKFVLKALWWINF